jgi:hypothetical protein
MKNQSRIRIARYGMKCEEVSSRFIEAAHRNCVEEKLKKALKCRADICVSY